MPALHKIGIRSTNELEEVIEWKHSHCDVDELLFDFPVFKFTGLTLNSHGLEVAVTFDQDGRFVTLDARIADRNTLYTLFKSSSR